MNPGIGKSEGDFILRHWYVGVAGLELARGIYIIVFLRWSVFVQKLHISEIIQSWERPYSAQTMKLGMPTHLFRYMNVGN